jgi:hypothetical protein
MSALTPGDDFLPMPGRRGRFLLHSHIFSIERINLLVFIANFRGSVYNITWDIRLVALFDYTKTTK